jgi:hypothetical protein
MSDKGIRECWGWSGRMASAHRHTHTHTHTQEAAEKGRAGSAPNSHQFGHRTVNGYLGRCTYEPAAVGIQFYRGATALCQYAIVLLLGDAARSVSGLEGSLGRKIIMTMTMRSGAGLLTQLVKVRGLYAIRESLRLGLTRSLPRPGVCLREDRGPGQVEGRTDMDGQGQSSGQAGTESCSRYLQSTAGWGSSVADKKMEPMRRPRTPTGASLQRTGPGVKLSLAYQQLV